jgi:hypothetical protein
MSYRGWSQALAKDKEEDLSDVMEALEVGELRVLSENLSYHV